MLFSSANTTNALMFVLRGRNSLPKPKLPAQVRGRNSPEFLKPKQPVTPNQTRDGSHLGPTVGARVQAHGRWKITRGWKHGQLQADCGSVRLRHGGLELDCRKMRGQHCGLASHCATWIQALCVWRHCLLCLPYRVGRALL